jgi:hypothetical protein
LIRIITSYGPLFHGKVGCNALSIEEKRFKLLISVVLKAEIMKNI